MREESQKRILTNAARLFAQQGFFNIRIADIAKEAEMSPGNIYWYYSSKEEILKSLLQNFFDGMEQVLIRAETATGRGQEKLDTLIDLELAFLREHGSDLQIYMSILGHGGVPFIRELGLDTVQIGAGYHKRLANLLNQAIQEGILPAQDTLPLIMSFFAFFNGLLITYGQGWQEISPAFIHQAVLRLLGRCEE
jgi:AcrR family transcriptional regulator